MWGDIGEFIMENWIDILLVIVGASAFFIYWAQERRKVSEAASLIVMQIEDLQKRIRETSSYISEGALNDTAFYESQILFKTDYWNQYKHYFIRKLDSLCNLPPRPLSGNREGWCAALSASFPADNALGSSGC